MLAKTLLTSLVLALIWAMPLKAASQGDLDALHEALRTEDMIRIFSDEGIADADGIQDDMFPGRGGSSWQRLVQTIYAPDQMTERFRQAFDRELRDTDVAALLAYYRSEPGQRITQAEVDSRAAITSDAVEEAARTAHASLLEDDPTRAGLLEDFVLLNDLVERNVAGAMTANLAFFRGLKDGGSFALDDAEMLAMVWEQEPDIRADTEGWVYAYLTLAYTPMSDDDLRTYTDLSATSPGRDLNRALFAGFYEVFQSISFELGRAASSFIVGEEL